ncbi:mRNA decapping enzyme 2 [Zostera marina]|uniref:mRNA decapping enzyme 2 n=1 Tax=Zostera marina TaxID=29655 RepID=A0A0K9P6A4_ZOSMR|nr:mRNA decapping enzyme 2 [Zostera marina]
MKNLPPPQELLDDLCSRFVLNVPQEDLESSERILFLVELAHWFYEDKCVETNPSLKSLSFWDFTILMFKGCTVLRPYIPTINDIYKDFTTYKFRVPVTGAIILDESRERCLLVKGWKSGASWSFPRGKKSKHEEDHDCAIREVLEETGCDISAFLKQVDFIEFVNGEQRMRLYIITGIRKDTIFAPQTNKEISEISWIPIDDLQSSGGDSVSRTANGLKLYMVSPFLAYLRDWILKSYPGSLKKSYSKGTTCLWKTKMNSSASSIQVNQPEQLKRSPAKPAQKWLSKSNRTPSSVLVKASRTGSNRTETR